MIGSITVRRAFKVLSFAIVFTGLLTFVCLTRLGKATVSAHAATKADAVTFECFNGHVFFSSESANAPTLNSDSCAQVTADLINEGFVLYAHNTVNFGAVFVFTRGAQSGHRFNQD